MTRFDPYILTLPPPYKLHNMAFHTSPLNTTPHSQTIPDLFYGFYGSHNGTRAINLGSVGDSELVCCVIDPATKEKMLAEPAMVTIHVRANRAPCSHCLAVRGRVEQGRAGSVGQGGG